MGEREEGKMNHPTVVSQAEWLAERKQLLEKEKEFTHRRDELSTKRRKLPMVKVEEEYVFDGPDGARSLGDLFEGRRQLIIYHFMFDPDWDEGCKGCSFFADNFVGSLVHLAARDTSFAVISRAPLSKIEGFKRRMGWSFLWLSSSRNDFNYDFRVTLDPERPEYEYNYTDAGALLNAGKIWSPKGEMPGLSVFFRDGTEIFHTYSSYQRGTDLFLNTYNFLDLTPLGRQEKNQKMFDWLRLHDRYPSQ